MVLDKRGIADYQGKKQLTFATLDTHLRQYLQWRYQEKYYDSAEIIKENLELLTGAKYYLYKVAFAKWQDGENMANAIMKTSLLRKRFCATYHFENINQKRAL